MSPTAGIQSPSQPVSPRKASLLRPIAVAAFCTFLAGASLAVLSAGQEPAATKPTNAAERGVDLTIMDKTCKPCEDFYHYADGLWLAKNPVPPAYPAWGRFAELAEKNRELLHQILENASEHQSGARLQRAEDRRFLCQLHG